MICYCFELNHFEKCLRVILSRSPVMSSMFSLLEAVPGMMVGSNSIRLLRPICVQCCLSVFVPQRVWLSPPSGRGTHSTVALVPREDSGLYVTELYNRAVFLVICG